MLYTEWNLEDACEIIREESLARGRQEALLSHLPWDFLPLPKMHPTDIPYNAPDTVLYHCKVLSI